jgi:uncharacterized protein
MSQALKYLMMLSLLAGLRAWAAEIDLEAQNPATAKIRARMAERAEKIDAWKEKGAIGEEATGLLKDRQPAGMSLSEKKEVRDLVVAEDEDRAALFRELRIAGNLPETELDSVAKAYAALRRNNAKATHWVEDPASRKWLQKKDVKQ